MPSDKTTNLQELKDLLLEFKEERDWDQFHDPKNLAEAISIEAAELQEKFLWRKTKDIVEKLKNDPEYRLEVEEEFADIVTFILNFANATGIDISKAVKDKVKKNGSTYQETHFEVTFG